MRVVNVRALLVALPGAVVIEDQGDGESRTRSARGCWRGARRAWQRDVGAATHHLVLEDDAQVCDRFAELAVEAVARAPFALILYFYSDKRGCSVAASWPSWIVPHWLAWADEHSDRIPHHDLLQRMGARALGVPLLYTSPSLVEHGGFPSLLDHHDNVKADHYDPDPERFVLVAR